jgi:hypothetical protein
MAAVGRVEPKTTQGCLPKSCHSLNLGMENFASILGDRFWPGQVEEGVKLLAQKRSFVEVMDEKLHRHHQ